MCKNDALTYFKVILIKSLYWFTYDNYLIFKIFKNDKLVCVNLTAIKWKAINIIPFLQYCGSR